MPTSSWESSNEIVVGRIKELVLELEREAGADVIAYSGPMFDGTPDVFKQLIEGKPSKRRRVLVWLETNGGFVESTERTAHILRHGGFNR